MRTFLLMLILPGYTFLVSAQTSTIATADSLYKAAAYDKAISIYTKLINEQGNEVTVEKGNAFMRRGLCWLNLNKQQFSITDLFSALKIFDMAGNEERVATCYKNIGTNYFKWRDTSLAKKYYLKSFSIYQKLKDSVKIARLMNDLAILHNESGEFQEALDLLTEGLTTYSAYLDDETRSKQLANLGITYMQINNDSAIAFFGKAELLAQQRGDSNLTCQVLLNKGAALMKKGKLNEALNCFTTSLPIAERLKDSSSLSVLYNDLATVHDSLGNYKEAYFYSRKTTILDRLQFDLERTQMSAEFSEKYESVQKDETINKQKIENKLNARNLILTFAALLFVLLLALIIYFYYRKARKLNIALVDSNQVKSKLFSIIGHDIRGPVSSMYARQQLSMQNGSRDIQETAAIFSAQCLGLLETLEELMIWGKSQLEGFSPQLQKIHVEQFTGQILSFMQQDIKLKKLDVKCHFSPGIMLITDGNMLRIILRNLIANGIRHCPEKGLLSLSCYIDGNNASIQIGNSINNGQVVHSPMLFTKINSDKSGLGVTLIKEFAQKLDGTITYNTSQFFLDALLVLPQNLAKDKENTKKDWAMRGFR